MAGRPKQLKICGRCNAGHELTTETARTINGYVQCRICDRARKRRYRDELSEVRAGAGN